MTYGQLEEIWSIEELREKVSLKDIMQAARDGNLYPWLEERCMMDEAASSIESCSEMNDDELLLELCRLLDIDPISLSEDECRILESTLHRERKQTICELPRDDDEQEMIFVATQDELVWALAERGNDEDICLCGGEFYIPMSATNINYFGCNGALIDLPTRHDVDFDDADIHLNNVQIFRHHPIEVIAQHSKNVKVLCGDALMLDSGTRDRAEVWREICRLIEGREPFETAAAFARRVESMPGVVVGIVLLDSANYNIEEKEFRVYPHWDIDFLKIARQFAKKNVFHFHITAKAAQKLYENERKLLLYADFRASGNSAEIADLYIVTEKGVRYDILREAVPVISVPVASGSCGAGYGLRLLYSEPELLGNHDGSRVRAFHTLRLKHRKSLEDFELLTMTLSALEWKRHNGPISLMTDTYGKNYIDNNGLSEIWDEIQTPLDEMDSLGIDENVFWAGAKIFALARQETPCVMMDLDFVAWEPLPFDEYGDGIAVVHTEAVDNAIYPRGDHFRFRDGWRLPRDLNWSRKAGNAAFVYFGNHAFIETYTNFALEFMKHANTQNADLAYMVFAEQRWMSMCAEKMGDPFYEICSSEALDIQRQFTHLWGEKERLRQDEDRRKVYCRACVWRLRRDFPTIMKQLRDMPWVEQYW